MIIPKDAAELEAVLSDDASLGEVMKSPQDFREFITNYRDKAMAKDETLAKQIKDQTESTMQAWLRENDADTVARPKWDSAPKSGKFYNKKALGAKIDDTFDSMADFLKTTWHNADDSNPEIARKRAAIRNSSSSVPSEGGFLVPERLRAELLRVGLETSIVRSRARTIPMDAPRIGFPKIDSTSNASTVYGGISASWVGEKTAVTASDAAFGQVWLDAKKLMAYTEAPNELIADSIISFEAFINEVFPEALAYFEDDAFINGTGAGEPQGILDAGNTAAIEITKQTGQAADTIVVQNLAKAYARMLPTSLGRAVWLAHPDTFPELATMALSVGTGGSAVWLTNAVDSPPMSIFGRPVIFTEKAATVGDAGDISFVDLGYYLIGDRQMLTASSSPHFKYSTDITAYKFIERVDGRPWLTSAITPRKGSNTMSPFVKIAARA